jgi:hypothetical protein
MIILKKYDDGSQSILFEKGDSITLCKDVYYGFGDSNCIPKGTEGIISRHTVRYEKLPSCVIAPYWIYFEKYGSIKVFPWDIVD